jgi:ATP phosphoribosyltransferase
MKTLGLPNGSLQEATIQLLNKVGIGVSINGRQFKAEIKGVDIFKKVIIMRPQDIPEAVTDGVLDCGICGWDCVMESEKEKELLKIAELWYGKKTRKAVKVVVIGKEERLRDDPDVLVAAEYPNLARTVFKRAKIRFSHGGTEQKVAYLKKYDYGVCVTETGRSIVENGLKIITVIMKSPTVIVAREKSEDIDRFAALLVGGLDAEKYVLIKMNVEKMDYPSIFSVIQAFKSPTISDLKCGGMAVEAVVRKRGIADLVILLRQRGANGIIVQDINLIV